MMDQRAEQIARMVDYIMALLGKVEELEERLRIVEEKTEFSIRTLAARGCIIDSLIRSENIKKEP